MKINKTYIKRPYIVPACNISKTELILQGVTPASVHSDNVEGDGDNDKFAKDRGFYSSGDKYYQGYDNEW